MAEFYNCTNFFSRFCIVNSSRLWKNRKSRHSKFSLCFFSSYNALMKPQSVPLYSPRSLLSFHMRFVSKKIISHWARALGSIFHQDFFGLYCYFSVNQFSKFFYEIRHGIYYHMPHDISYEIWSKKRHSILCTTNMNLIKSKWRQTHIYENLDQHSNCGFSNFE